MNLKRLVIHKLEKQFGGNAHLTKASRELSITDVHINFMTDVKNVYYKKSNPIYGVFDSSGDSYPFQKYLDAYLNSECDFLEFTEKAILHFKTIINDVSQATGGYVLFCHFETTEDFVGTIMLNDKESYIINDSLDINSNASLDIEKLDVANFTNCSKWNNSEDVYLSFTRGKKDVSNYFKKFIGCTDYTSAKEASENLKKALNDYFLQAGFDKTKIENTKASIFAYCEQKMKNKEDINLGFVSSLVDHDGPELFKEFASSETYQVSATFKGHNTLRSLKFYSYKSKELTIVFDSKLLNESIFYDDKNNELLLKEIPSHLRLQLNKQVPIENSDE